MKKVLLIGDSIRLGYQKEVAKLLSDTAEVTGPDDNCRFSAYTLFRVSGWAHENDYDVIQWNNGQWDTCYMADGNPHTPLTTYLEIQDRICSILIKKTKRLIFATTTPVWPEMITEVTVNPRKNEDICEYNRAVTELLSKYDIEINDLHSCINQDLKKYIKPDMVHLTEEGAHVAAKCVADMIGKN